MNISNKIIQIAGVNCQIQGSDNDRYFQNLKSFADETNLLVKFVQKYIPDNSTIIDVGANIGLTSLAMSHVNPKSNIIAIEPSPSNAAFFRFNTKHSNQIKLLQCGVSSEVDSLSFVVSTDGANSHFATDNYLYAGHPDFKPIKIPVTTLDNLYAQGEFKAPISLIKIDVEGFEPHVLNGAINLLRNNDIFIWMEFNSVALNVAHGFSPMAFSVGLFKCFDVFKFGEDGTLTKIPNPSSLVHDNIVLNGSIEDIVLKPLTNFVMPCVDEFTLPPSIFEELNRLRASIIS